MLEDSQMPVTSTLVDQAYNAIERKLFAMKGFHHPGGSQQAFLPGLAHWYNLAPFQLRAQHAGQCGLELEVDTGAGGAHGGGTRHGGSPALSMCHRWRTPHHRRSYGSEWRWPAVCPISTSPMGTRSLMTRCCTGFALGQLASGS